MSKPLCHEFDSSMTCNYCGVAENATNSREPCPSREQCPTPVPAGTITLRNEFHEDKWLRYEHEIGQKIYLRMREWIADPNRKQSIFAFTAGLERTVARMVEDAIRANTADTITLRKLDVPDEPGDWLWFSANCRMALLTKVNERIERTDNRNRRMVKIVPQPGVKWLGPLPTE